MNYLKKNKKIVIFVYCLSFWCYICNGQLLKQRQNRLETIKMSYFTKKLNLSGKEAQNFWSIYPQYLSEISVQRHHYYKYGAVCKEEVSLIRKKYKDKFFLILKDTSRVQKVFYLEKNYRDMLKQELRQRVVSTKK